MDRDLPAGVEEVDMEQWDEDMIDDMEEHSTPKEPRSADPTSEMDLGNESFLPIEVSSPSGPEPHTQEKNDEDEFVEMSEQEFVSENLVTSGNSLGDKFKDFLREKQRVVLDLDEKRVSLLPAPLRQPIQNIIAKIKRWASRNPTGASLGALQVLADRLDEFLELQQHREDHDYEAQCRDLLTIIYQNTIEAQRMSRKLKDAAIPRALDEYE